MIIGFTGTRYGLSNHQLAWLYQLFEDATAPVNKPAAFIAQVHHGACVGADEAVHEAAFDNEIPVHVWPPTNPKWLAAQCLVPHRLATIHPARSYLARDREIVNATKGLIALPRQEKQPESQMEWGGTWYTVDFAERTLKPVMICYPSGRVEHRYPKGENNYGR